MLRIGTWNLRELYPGSSGSNVEQEIVDRVNAEDLHVLLLQEVRFDRTGWSAALEILARKTDLHHTSGSPLSRTIRFPGALSGVAIATRLPHTDPRRVLLPNPGLVVERPTGRLVTWDKGLHMVRTGHRGLVVGSVHSFPFHMFGRDPADGEFNPVWRAMAAVVDEVPARHVVLGGDFNATDREVLLRFVTRRRLTAANQGGVATHGDRTDDDILHDSHAVLRRFSIVPGYSDHALCVAELSFGEGPNDVSA